MVKSFEDPEGSKRAGGQKKSKWEAQRGRRKLKNLAPVIVVLIGILLVLGGVLLLPTGDRSNDCLSLPAANIHIHAHLSIFNGASPVEVPANIGLWQNRTMDHTLDLCSSRHEGAPSPLHTHDTDGTIHIESIVQRDYTLGEFFRVWGQPLGPTQTLDMVPDGSRTLHLYVNGAESQEWGALVLRDGQSIEIRFT